MSKKKTKKGKGGVATHTAWLDWLWSKAWPLVAGGGLVVAIIAVMGWVNYSKQYKEQLRLGEDQLRLGLYPETKAAYQKAINLHPLRHVVLLGKFFGEPADSAAQQTPDLLGMDKDALWGLKKASAFDSADPRQIELALRQLENDNPKDLDNKTLLGKFHAAQAVQTQSMDFALAEQDYQAVLEQDPHNAEAQFGLGYIRWLQGRLAESHTYYQQAQESSKYTPSYTINLAGLYIEQVSVHPPGSVGVSPTEMAAKMAALPGKSGLGSERIPEQKNYVEALKLLGSFGFNQDYPIAAFETALVFRLQGKLKESQEWFNTALMLMDDEKAKAKPDNQIPWQIKTKTALISLSKPDDKKYYLYLSLAASQFLDGDTANAKKTLVKARGLSDTHPATVKELLNDDLSRLAEERPTLANNIKVFRAELLTAFLITH